MAHFYLDEQLERASVGDRVTLSGAEARHAVTVSRIAVGETVTIGNGSGLVVSGPAVVADHTDLTIEVVDAVQHDARSPLLFLVQALAKGDRDELAVQAATELGADGVVPWQAARSISRWEGAKVAKGRDRWTAIVREAVKQSIRPWMPDVLDLVTTKQLAALAGGARMLLLDPEGEHPLSTLELDDRDVLVVVGPEGGIAPQERDLLVAAGAQTVRLGREVLRTSTAGPAALAVLNARLGRW
ncbi:16S rRNA (uracil1498-N3)-methyltransferase [Microbacteriaceae bacterium SG_E_30_P1]|uniref:Ribosomal RNA small subunit methyltransferase E n=1 Tax=Antiquaquibacter oligotrophicus TaxID=2880260 RepID=A0ABT6KMA7_9MICO|nr:16S rRNA (uracil(1498)-N(3))-methyltransferase [Antiquaquibacter oligotrophicus]MDH6181146.1 16S rRNA (uracil1498-N3)-methyltransferase [Antiquaquibacter oligotrophicus]UDF13158.1 16S rRNA (uracil(1498)-N(3))-methyltransferase [Antiquaquibacter oligotrophicus]